MNFKIMMPRPGMAVTGKRAQEEDGLPAQTASSKVVAAVGLAGGVSRPGAKSVSFAPIKIKLLIGNDTTSCAVLLGIVGKFTLAGKAAYAPGTNGAWQSRSNVPGRLLSCLTPVNMSE